MRERQRERVDEHYCSTGPYSLLRLTRKILNGHMSYLTFNTSIPILNKALYQFVPFRFFFSVALRPNAGHGLLILEVSKSHTATHHSRKDSSGRVISSSQRPLPDNTQHSQQINIHAPGGIRTHDLSRRAAVDLRLRPRDHWDRHFVLLLVGNY